MPVFLNKDQKNWRKAAIRRQRASGFSYGGRYSVSSSYMKRFGNNYLTLVKLGGYKIPLIVKDMKKRGYIGFTRQFLYDCYWGKNNTCYMDVLCNLCDIIGQDLVYVLSLDYDYNDYKKQYKVE